MNADGRTPTFPHDAVPGARRIVLREAPLDVAFGLLLVAFAIVLWVGADYIESSNHKLMGPAGFPRGVALILGFSSLLMTIRGALALRSGARGEEIGIDQPVALLLAMGLIVVYPVLITAFGYYLATGPWLVALLFASGNRKILLIIGCSIGFLVFTKLIFQIVMGIPLP